MLVFQIMALYTARASLGIARMAMSVSRAAVGQRDRQEIWQRDRAFYVSRMMWLAMRLMVAQVALGVAEAASDFAGWISGMDSDDDPGRGR